MAVTSEFFASKHLYKDGSCTYLHIMWHMTCKAAIWNTVKTWNFQVTSNKLTVTQSLQVTSAKQNTTAVVLMELKIFMQHIGFVHYARNPYCIFIVMIWRRTTNMCNKSWSSGFLHSTVYWVSSDVSKRAVSTIMICIQYWIHLCTEVDRRRQCVHHRSEMSII